MKKLGLDIHGVIDKDPDMFVGIAKLVRASGHEVHIITGVSKQHVVWDQLKSYNDGEKWWDYIFSVEDWLLENNIPKTKDENMNWHFDDRSWNIAKGLYCRIKQISLHIDDSEIYGKYFTTSYFLYK